MSHKPINVSAQRMCDFYFKCFGKIQYGELLKKAIKLSVGEMTIKDWGTNVQI